MYEHRLHARTKRPQTAATPTATTSGPAFDAPAPETLSPTSATHFDFGTIAILPVQTQGHTAIPQPTDDLAERIRGRQGHGIALPEPVQRQMEAGLGDSFAEVRVHTDAEADRLSRGVGATAFTSGRDIFFASGAYDPGSAAGQHLLAHELTHTVQQASGPVAGTFTAGGVAVSDPGDPFESAAQRSADAVVAGRAASDAVGVATGSQASGLAVQRFGSKEHRDIGDEAALGERMLTLDIGDPQQPLTYGQIVALAGDYFESIEEMRSLADPKNPEGQAQIRWAREDALGIKGGPPISDTAAKAAKDRYYSLAAKNISHFSAGGTARNEYERVHEQALGEAFRAGLSSSSAKFADAKVTEAFSNHYLTDMFSAGHVRTPRQEIKEWYKQQFPPTGGIDQLVTYIAKFMTDKLIDYGDVPWYWPYKTVVSRIRARVEDLGGPAIKAYSLGDIVSLAYHDYDNKNGLWVTSEAGPDGKVVPGGYVWPEFDKGDSHLSESPLTKQMAVAAVRDSLHDLEAVYDAGQEAGQEAGWGQTLTTEELDLRMQLAIASTWPYTAEKYIPREAKAGEIMDGGNVQFDWHWGSMDPVLRAAVDESVKKDIAGEMEKITPGDIDYNRRGDEDKDGAIHLQVSKAFGELTEHLRSSGIAALELAMNAPAKWDEPSDDWKATVPPDAAPPPSASLAAP